jgi:hypothetical protein
MRDSYAFSKWDEWDAPRRFSRFDAMKSRLSGIAVTENRVEKQRCRQIATPRHATRNAPSAHVGRANFIAGK